MAESPYRTPRQVEEPQRRTRWWSLWPFLLTFPLAFVAPFFLVETTCTNGVDIWEGPLAQAYFFEWFAKPMLGPVRIVRNPPLQVWLAMQFGLSVLIACAAQLAVGYWNRRARM